MTAQRSIGEGPAVNSEKFVVGVIPARFGSTRFPGKPLAQILGKPMIAWVIEQVKKAQGLSELIVATDHSGIAEVSAQAGARVVMTPSDLPTGSDRVFRAVENIACQYVINIQGDEPALDPNMIDSLVACLRANPNADMATLGREPTAEDLESPTTAKIVLNRFGEALYFSRFAIPYSRQLFEAGRNPASCLKHVGIYGYKKDFLARFCQEPPCGIEMAESLEQLRALYLGAKIQVAKVSGDSWGVDRPEDIEKVEKLLSRRNG
jgi:3-deoxy-manno-octulosonate cytidylyltransferase (CMP-KDO synthetase)